MRGRFDIASRWPPGVWALVALTVALRLLVVPGYMVQASPDGGVTVVLCTADGAVTRTLHADGTASSPDDGQTAPSAKDSACVFALAGPALAAPAGATLAVAPVTVATAPPPPVAATALGRGLAAPPPPATGPPFSL